MRFDIDSVILKDTWTGEEAGKVLIYGCAIKSKYGLDGGKDVEPDACKQIDERLRTFKESVADDDIFDRFTRLCEWLSENYERAVKCMKDIEGLVDEFMALIREAETEESDIPFMSPERIHELKFDFGLERYSSANPGTEKHIENAERLRRMIERDVRWLCGYNAAVGLIAQSLEMPEVEAFKIDIEKSLNLVNNLSDVCLMMFWHVGYMNYPEKTARDEKREIVRKVFRPFDIDIVVSEEQIKRALELLEGLEAFKAENDREKPGQVLLEILTGN